MKPKSNILPIIISSLVVAAGVYWYFFTGKESEPSLTKTVVHTGAQARFQSLVAELMPITFDTTVLSDARFMALVDLTTAVAPESIGRTDPFTP